jgi:hypothetical protein
MKGKKIMKINLFTPLPGCRRVGRLSGEWALCIKVDGGFTKDLKEKPEKFGEYDISPGDGELNEFARSARKLERDFVQKMYYDVKALKLHCVYVTTTEAPEQKRFRMTENQTRRNPYVPGGLSIEYLAEYDIALSDGVEYKDQLSGSVFHDRLLSAESAGAYGACTVANYLSPMYGGVFWHSGLFAAIAAKHWIKRL